MPRATIRSAITSRRASPWRQRHEDGHLVLVAPVVVTAAAERLRLGLGDPGHLEEKHDQEHRHHDRDPAVWGRERDHGPGDPVQPLEEIVGMPRPAPEAVAGRLALVGGIALPDGELGVGGHLAGDGAERERRARPGEPRHLALVGRHEREREREDDDEQRLSLEEDEERPVHVRRPTLAQILVAPVFLLAGETGEEIGAEPYAPDRAEAGDEHPVQRRPFRQQRVGDCGACDAERPGHVHVARVGDADRHEPDAHHRQGGADGADEQQEPG